MSEQIIRSLEQQLMAIATENDSYQTQLAALQSKLASAREVLSKIERTYTNIPEFSRDLARKWLEENDQP